MNAKMTKQKNHQSFRKAEVAAQQIAPYKLEEKRQEDEYDRNCTYPTTIYMVDVENMNRQKS